MHRIVIMGKQFITECIDHSYALNVTLDDGLCYITYIIIVQYVHSSYIHEEISPIDTASAPCASTDSGILIATGAPMPLNVATTAPVGSEPVIIVLARRREGSYSSCTMLCTEGMSV